MQEIFIRNFIMSMLKEAGVVVASDEEWEKIIDEQTIAFNEFIPLKLLEKLPTPEAEEFVRLQQKNAPQEEIVLFLQEKIPNYQEVIMNIMNEFRDIYIKSFNTALDYTHRTSEEINKTLNQNNI